MFATLCLLSGVLVAAQPPAPAIVDGNDAAASPRPRSAVQSGTRRPVSGDWAITPRLPLSMELLYKGTFTEEASGGSVEFQRAYRFENRVLVLDSQPQSTEVAVMTVLKDTTGSGTALKTSPESAGKPQARSARLEQLKVDDHGKATADNGVSTLASLDSPPTLECGMFIATPAGHISADRSWVVTEPGRPGLTWEVTGTGVVDGTPCVKLTGVQKSADWDRPRGDRRSWRRQDTVWLSTRTGVAHRVERVVEQRSAVRSEPTVRSVLSYELESNIQYPAELVKERQRDILMCHQLAESARPHLEQPSRNSTQLAALVARADKHLQTPSTSPYREAIAHLRDKLEASRRGEITSTVAPEVPGGPENPPPAAPSEVKLGHPAPDFVATDMCVAGKTASLKNWRGKPVLLVFYNPNSRTLDAMMRFVSDLANEHQKLAVILLAMSGTPAEVSAQKIAKHWSYPILSGAGLNQSYTVDATPRFVLIDASGIVRAMLTGWGLEAPAELTTELRNCLK